MPRKYIESYSLQEEMRADLMNCYREVAPTCLTQCGAWRKTTHHQAKRFYVSDERALQIMKLVIRGDYSVIDNMMPLHRQMWLDIRKIMLELSNRPENANKTIGEICRLAIRKPAPRFYISEIRMRDIYRHIKHGRYDEYGRYIPNIERRYPSTRDYSKYYTEAYLRRKQHGINNNK